MTKPIIYLTLNKDFFLSPLELTDKDAQVEYLNNEAFHDNMDSVPYPYTEKDAEDWLAKLKEKKPNEKHTTLAIRRSDGKMIGSIGVYPPDKEVPQIAEIGGWVAKPYWNQGIMSAAMNVFIDYCFKELELVRIFARVFDKNPNSWRTAEKAGFKLEGFLRKHVYRNNQYLDDRFYGLLKEDWLKIKQ